MKPNLLLLLNLSIVKTIRAAGEWGGVNDRKSFVTRFIL
jgi:hypothetical protein